MAIQDIIDAFRSTFRDYVVDGVSASGKHKVKKADARDLGTIIADAVSGASAGDVRAETWTALAGIPGERDGQPGEVPDQAGTHTDPVTGGTVPNAGWYRWDEAESGWRWVSAIPQIEVDFSSNEEVAVGAVTDEAVSPATLLNAYKPGNEAMSLEFMPGMLVDNRYFPIQVDSDGGLLFSFDLEDQVYDIPIRSVPQLVEAATMEFSYTLSASETIYPLVINSDYEVLLGIDITTGLIVGAGLEGGTSGGGADYGESMAYISGDELHAIGGIDGDRVLDNAATRTWLSTQTSGTGARAIFQEGSYKQLVRVSFETGDLFFDGEVTIWVGLGQSNAEGQASSAGVQAIVPTARYGNRLRMPNPNIWYGITTTAGTSIALDPDDITELMPLVDTIAPSGSHGTVSIAAAARTEMAAASRELGWTPEMIAWTGAEGGQSIYNLMENPPSGYYSFENETALLTKIVALIPDKKVVVRWLDMAQGEANSTGLSTLGELHDDYRAEYEAMVKGINNQDEPVRMLSWQMSSFMNTNASTLSILTYALANETAFGNFWCAGPTYIFPFTSTDYLHQTSLGHQMRGEMMRAAAKSVEKTGYWRPLHMVSASITGANQITVVLSQAAVIDTDWITDAVANSGISVDSRTVSAVNVTGTSMVITTVEAAAGATTVRAAMNLQSDPRTEANIPRSNIRSTTSYGTFSADCGIYAGVQIYKPLCHQALTIS